MLIHFNLLVSHFEILIFRTVIGGSRIRYRIGGFIKQSNTEIRENRKMGGRVKLFTLVEVMIVIAIIGLIAAMGIPKFNAYRENAFAAQRAANAERILSAIDSYVSAHKIRGTELSNAAVVQEAYAGARKWGPYYSSKSVGPGNNDKGVFAYVKGGAAGLEVDGMYMRLPVNLDTDAQINRWKPYGYRYEKYNEEYAGLRR